VGGVAGRVGRAGGERRGVGREEKDRERANKREMRTVRVGEWMGWEVVDLGGGKGPRKKRKG